MGLQALRASLPGPVLVFSSVDLRCPDRVIRLAVALKPSTFTSSPGDWVPLPPAVETPLC